MSFFGVLGGNNNDKNCECNKTLKEHLRKCAGYGQLPPLQKGCCPPPKKECNPCEEKKPVCCPTKGCKLEAYSPKCEVPPTMTFKCPESCCEPPKDKPRCCPAPPPPCSDIIAQNCPDLCGAKTACGSGSTCSAPPKPLQREKKSCREDTCGP